MMINELFKCFCCIECRKIDCVFVWRAEKLFKFIRFFEVFHINIYFCFYSYKLQHIFRLICIVCSCRKYVDIEIHMEIPIVVYFNSMNPLVFIFYIVIVLLVLLWDRIQNILNVKSGVGKNGRISDCMPRCTRQASMKYECK